MTTWARSSVTLRVRSELRELMVTIRIARTYRVAAAGSWLSLPNSPTQKALTGDGRHSMTVGQQPYVHFSYGPCAHSAVW